MLHLTSKRIGIDLDNTILEYRAVFRAVALERNWVHADCPAEKAAIKQQLIEVAGDAREGELRWQRLQAAVYGDQIHRARILDGFIEFIQTMRAGGDDLYIVSHKSETSHIDPTVNLREHAMATLEQRGFFTSEQQGGLGFTPEKVFFESTRDAKVARIQYLRLGWFIDDMSLVLLHEQFPDTTQGLLIGEEKHQNLPCFDHWSQIRAYFRVASVLPPAFQRNISSRQTLDKGGNNRLEQWTFEDNSKVVIKNFLIDKQDKRPRRRQEWRFSRFLWDRQIRCIPQPIATLEDANVMAWVDGSPVGGGEETIIDQMSEFLIALDQVGSQAEDPEAIGPAADARLAPGDHLKAIDRRRQTILDACEESGQPQIIDFINHELEGLHKKAKQHFQQVCVDADLDPEAEIDRALWFPSPSDFGAHNCLISPQNELVFMDFEYAGWDDPAKLLCDFLRHVGNHVPIKTRIAIIKKFVAARTCDPTLWDRFRALADLNAVEWILIVLNVAARHEARRKQFAGSREDHESLVVQRFQRAQTLCEQFVPIQTLIEEET